MLRWSTPQGLRRSSPLSRADHDLDIIPGVEFDGLGVQFPRQLAPLGEFDHLADVFVEPIGFDE